MNQQLLTVEDLAALLKVSRSWIYQQTRSRGSGGLPYIKLGKYLRFDEAAVRHWLSRKRQPRNSPDWTAE